MSKIIDISMIPRLQTKIKQKNYMAILQYIYLNLVNYMQLTIVIAIILKMVDMLEILILMKLSRENLPPKVVVQL